MRKRWLVSGRVQGVCFRQATLREAWRLGIAVGFVRNLADGRVEVVAESGAEALERLHEWLLRGPALARVESIQETCVPEPLCLPGFRVES